MVRIVAADNACENASGHACKCLFHPLCSSCGVDYLILSSTAENYREDVRFCVWMCLKVWVCVCVRACACSINFGRLLEFLDWDSNS